MKSSVIFILACLAISAFAQTDIAQLEKTNFGKSLLDTVQLQLNSEQGVNALLKVLDDMRDEMNRQKEAHEHEHQKFQADCAADIDIYQNEIKEATVVIVDTERRIAKGQEELDAVNMLLDQLYSQLKLFTDALAKLNKIREEEASEFKKQMDEHDITTAAIEEAKRYFVQIRGEVSFLQTKKNVFAQLSTHFHNAKSQVKSKGYKALFNIMSQITSRAPFDNVEIVTKILELCNRVLENVAESRLAEQEAEKERIELYNAKKKVLDANIYACQQKINMLETQKKALEEHIATNQGILEDQTQRRDQNQKLLDARMAECDNEINEYGELRKKTMDQIMTLEQVITLVETNLAVMKQYLKERRA